MLPEIETALAKSLSNLKGVMFWRSFAEGGISRRKQLSDQEVKVNSFIRANIE